MGAHGEGSSDPYYPLEFELPFTVDAVLTDTGVSNPWIGYAAGGLIISGAAIVLYSRRLTK